MKRILSILVLASASLAPVVADVYTGDYNDRTMMAEDMTPGTSYESSPTMSSDTANYSTEEMMPSTSEESYASDDMNEGSEEMGDKAHKLADAMKTIMHHMKEFKHEVSGKTFTFPGDLVKDALHLKAQMMKLCAEKLRMVAELNFKAGANRTKWNNAAQKAEAFATALEGLPVNKKMKKEFKNVHEWMELMMQKHAIKGRFFKEIANQLNNKDMEKMADMMMNMHEGMNRGEEAHEESEESCPNEGQEK